jgi:hypothetical protein
MSITSNENTSANVPDGAVFENSYAGRDLGLGKVGRHYGEEVLEGFAMTPAPLPRYPLMRPSASQTCAP